MDDRLDLRCELFWMFEFVLKSTKTPIVKILSSQTGRLRFQLNQKAILRTPHQKCMLTAHRGA